MRADRQGQLRPGASPGPHHAHLQGGQRMATAATHVSTCVLSTAKFGDRSSRNAPRARLRSGR